MATTRTDDIMRGTTQTNSVNLGITTKCTMKCPNCTIDVPGRAAAGTATHVSYQLILGAMEVLTEKEPLRRVHLTGGEPTMHPDFALITTYLRVLRNEGWVKYLTIETNGSGCKKYDHLFTDPKLFDRVFITHYVKDKIYPDNYDNTEVIEWAKSEIGDRLITEEPVEHMRKHDNLIRLGRPYGKPYEPPCSKFWDPGLPSGWYDGLIYPCCVSVGIDRNLGIPVTADWRVRIKHLDMGCAACTYRGT